MVGPGQRGDRAGRGPPAAVVVYTQDWHPPVDAALRQGRRGLARPLRGRDVGRRVPSRSGRRGRVGAEGDGRRGRVLRASRMRDPVTGDEASTGLTICCASAGRRAGRDRRAGDRLLRQGHAPSTRSRLGFATTVVADAIAAVDLQPGDGDAGARGHGRRRGRAGVTERSLSSGHGCRMADLSAAKRRGATGAVHRPLRADDGGQLLRRRARTTTPRSTCSCGRCPSRATSWSRRPRRRARLPRGARGSRAEAIDYLAGLGLFADDFLDLPGRAALHRRRAGRARGRGRLRERADPRGHRAADRGAARRDVPHQPGRLPDDGRVEGGPGRASPAAAGSSSTSRPGGTTASTRP